MRGCPFAAPGPVTPPGLFEALVLIARRILPFEDGKFSPSPPPLTLTQLTDHDLIVAKDAAWQVTAEKQPPPSGKARYRLLAWVVADARGAATSLAPTVAEKVGKRLEAQALKARGNFGEQRSLARHAAAADASLAGGLPAALAAIDEAERLATEAARREVYVGFHELEAPPPPPPTGTPGGNEPDTALSRTESARAAAELAEREQRQAEEAERQRTLPNIPQELAGALGTDGVQVLWRVATEQCWSRRAIPESGDWWKKLPKLVKCLLEDAANQEAEFEIHKLDVRSIERQIKQAETRGWMRGCAEEIEIAFSSDIEEAERCADVAEKSEAEMVEKLAASEAEVAQLRQQLSEARGREVALEGVISRHMRA